MLIGHTQHRAQASGAPLAASQAVRYHDLDARASRPAVQAPDGSCDWSDLRPYVDWHVSHGIVGVHVLGGTPAWDTDSTEPDGYGRPGGAAVPRSWDGYWQHLRSFCATFSAAQVPYLSIWNEPMGPRSFDGSVADLIEMQRMLRAGAPDRRILTPSFYSLAHARAFLEACPRELYDVVDLHLYGQTADQLTATLDAYAALAPGKRLAITEIGWQPDSQTGAGWKWPGMTPQQRADEWLRICRMCEARGDVELLLWYSLDGYAADEKHLYTMGNRPELLAAQQAAVERRTSMATTTTNPGPTELIAAGLRSLQEAQAQAITAVGGALTLLGQVRAYLTTVLAAGGSGGSISPDDLQAILDMISAADEELRGLAERATAAVAANQLPSTTANPPPSNTPPTAAAPGSTLVERAQAASKGT